MKKIVRLDSGFEFHAKFENAALDALSDVLERGMRVGVACSGGADSVFLLLALKSIFAEKKSNLIALHFNHLTRANASDGDEEFVKKFCEDEGIECVTGKPAKPPTKKTEEEFRSLRLAFFDEQVKTLKLGAIAQGHHQDDLCETLLMRLSRGAGTDGLAAPRPVSQRKNYLFVRPLLTLRKTEIVEVLELAKVAWREDASNDSCNFFRNRVRKILLPLAEEISPTNFALGASRTRRLLQEDADFISRIYKDAMLKENGENYQKLSSILIPQNFAKDASILRRAAVELLSGANLSAHTRATGLDDFVNSAVKSETKLVRMSAGKKFLAYSPAERTMGIFVNSNFEPTPYQTNLKFGLNVLASGLSISVKLVEDSDVLKNVLQGNNDNASRTYLDARNFVLHDCKDGSKTPLFARSSKASDSFIPLGSNSQKKVYELLGAKKIPILKRREFPTICIDNGEILWVPNLPPARNYAMHPDCTLALELTFSANRF